MPRPLLSEALRGHGALLRDAEGERFVDELAPRDVVSRAMAARMAEQRVDHLWLDARGLERFDERFPTISASLRAIGLDPGRDWLPIAPAAHHLSGGVMTDLRGATSLEGLWAAGEAACTGVHGANRLASNSLLEGMVFGARLAEAIQSGVRAPESTGVLRRVLGPAVPATDDGIGVCPGRCGPTVRLSAGPSGPASPESDFDVPKRRESLQSAMTAGAGVVRTADSLAEAGQVVEELAGRLDAVVPSVETGELANLVTVAGTLLSVAGQREETRGAHARADYPATDDAWRCRLVVRGDHR
jgi:L-aspartate oxidase